jgi:hypothetical protein
MLRSCTVTSFASAHRSRTLSGSFGSASRDRRQHRDLVGVAHDVTRRGRFTVEPHLRAGEDGGEGLAVPHTRRPEDRSDGVAGDLVSPSPRGLAGGGEQAKHGHRVHDS